MVRYAWEIAGILTGLVFFVVGTVRISRGDTSAFRSVGLAISGLVLALLSVRRLWDRHQQKNE
jgi:hypothetical protein